MVNQVRRDVRVFDVLGKERVQFVKKRLYRALGRTLIRGARIIHRSLVWKLVRYTHIPEVL